MSTTLRVLKGGICSTLQDLGRIGFRACGVPASGALDPVALKLANALVGNEESVPGIEMLYSGIALRAEGGPVRIAVCGAAATLARNLEVSPRALAPWHSTTMQAGDVLRVDHVKDTAAAYLAIEGGIRAPAVLGSGSTYVRGGMGGWHGRAIRTGDVLPLNLEEGPARAERRYVRLPQLAAPEVLRVIAGPQQDRFDPASLNTFFSAPYTVTSNSDRSGLRLEGPLLRHVNGFDLSSEGIVPGSIQVPGSGLPVILIADHPTVGGYPKIATIISADVPAAGRLRIGSRVAFRSVDTEAAQRAREDSKRELDAIIASLVDFDDTPT